MNVNGPWVLLSESNCCILTSLAMLVKNVLPMAEGSQLWTVESLGESMDSSLPLSASHLQFCLNCTGSQGAVRG